MRSPVCAFVLGSVMLSACKKPAPKPAATNDSVMSGNPAMAPLDYLAAQAKAKKFAEKSITTSELTSAIQKFNAMEDRYPRDLGELVVRDEAVPVVVVVLVHGLDHCVHVLLDGVGVEWGGEALRPGGEGRGARRRGGRAHGGGARLAAQRELSHNQLIIIFPIIIFILLD